MKKYLPSFIAFIVIVVITLSTFIFVRQNLIANQQVEFNRSAASRVVAIQRVIQEKFLILESIRTLYSVYDGVPDPAFAHMGDPFVDQLQGVQAYQWVIPLKNDERQSFEQLMQIRFPGFFIKERNIDGEIVSAQERDSYYVIAPIPDKPLEITDGFDLSSEPVRADAIQRAVSSRAMSVSERVALLQMPENRQFGFLAFAPVFSSDSTLLGLVTGVFSIGELIDSAIALLEPQSIEITIVDEDAIEENAFLYRMIGSLPEQGGSTLIFSAEMPVAYHQSFPVGNKNWSVTVNPGESYLNDKQTNLPWVVLIGGICSAVLVAFYFALQLRQIERINTAQQEVKDMQMQLERSQKMEAVGQLASGIAHDFNNILTSILGYSSLASDIAGSNDRESLQRYLNEIIRAGDRGKDLVAKLSTFNRNKPAAAEPQNLTELISNSLELLRPAITSKILIDFQSTKNLPALLIDQTSFEQIVMNLCINARDAIAEGNPMGTGSITINLFEQEISDAECLSCHNIVAGNYLILSVRDTGKGVSFDNLAKIFNPFFTTKEPGKGTGMGLSIIHGIVHSYQGHILLGKPKESGCEFRILFPINNSDS